MLGKTDEQEYKCAHNSVLQVSCVLKEYHIFSSAYSGHIGVKAAGRFVQLSPLSGDASGHWSLVQFNITQMANLIKGNSLCSDWNVEVLWQICCNPN